MTNIKKLCKIRKKAVSEMKKLFAILICLVVTSGLFFEKVDAAELQILNSEDLGMAFEPEQRYEQPDGSDIIFDKDILGEKRTSKTVAGPFANWGEVNDILYEC